MSICLIYLFVFFTGYSSVLQFASRGCQFVQNLSIKELISAIMGSIALDFILVIEKYNISD